MMTDGWVMITNKDGSDWLWLLVIMIIIAADIFLLLFLLLMIVVIRNICKASLSWVTR